MTTSTSTTQAAAEQALRAHGLAYPHTSEHFPWGHRALKVKGKVFVFFGAEAGRFFFTVKLPVSAGGALSLPFCAPTGYGLGKSGWVTATLSPSEPVPVDIFRVWLDESYRAVAPAQVVASLAAKAPASSTTAKPSGATKQPAAKKKPAAKKAPAAKKQRATTKKKPATTTKARATASR